ncbi:MAG: hypothetical protein R3F13_03375 [Prosthecobacter sp.]
MSSPLALLKALALLLALILMPIALIALACVVTWPGTILGVSLGLLGLGPLLFWIGDERGAILQLRLGKAFLALGVIGLTSTVWRAPDGHTLENARIHSRYADGGWHYERFAFGNVLPEIDQIHLGYAAALAFDPFFNREQKRDLSAMTDAIHAEMAKDAEFQACGSALTTIYDEMTFTEFRDGHYFHYIPSKHDRSKPAPALVFLHGSGGNFKAYVWLLSKVADETGCTVIAPTFGLGNWEKRGAYDAITNAIADAHKHAAIDPDQIHLMGLSNGGKGVCLAESEEGPHFRSLIFLSGVFHNRITPEQLAERLKPRTVLVLSGGSDDRVPWNYVSDYAAKLKAGGLNVTTRQFPDDDHFLFFRKRKEVLRTVAEWLKP